jgi:putative transposase
MSTFIGEIRMELFDRTQEFEIVYRKLPHLLQPGAVAFITWRTWDSMPAEVIRQWQAERDALLRKHRIEPSNPDWQVLVSALGNSLASEVRRVLSDRWNDHLDDCHGACVLRRPEISTIVADSFRHFDGDRYELTDFVIMPNHVHLLAAFPTSQAMLEQCESWKHFTATKINRILGVKDRFWQQDGFDHLVRSEEQLQFLRDYIANNPIKARLKPGEYRLHSSRSARGEHLAERDEYSPSVLLTLRVRRTSRGAR